MQHKAAPVPNIFEHDALQTQYEALAELIQTHERFLVVAHEGPDGDAIGSTLGMSHLLWNLGKTVVPFNVDGVPHNLAFLPGSDRVQTELDPADAPEVTLQLDCADAYRVGAEFPAHGWAPTLAILDHHATGEGQGSTLYIKDTSAAAVGEMVVRLAMTLGVPMTLPMAECCYCSLLTDTGSFRYGNTSPTTFQIASVLLEAGVDPWQMTCSIFENDPVERVRLLAKVLETLHVSRCGRLAFLRVDQAMMVATGTSRDMLDGFVNYARRIKGVVVCPSRKVTR
ncbi:MAG: DHH family phosphoesterase, partial [Myxococcota bacterium]